MAKRIKRFLHNPSEVLLTNSEQRDGHMQSLDQDKFFEFHYVLVLLK
jgi:hypothetical protein